MAKLFHARWSAIKSFRRCHKLYDYAWLQNLTRKKPQTPLIRGSILGRALDQVTSGKNPEVVFKEYDKLYGKLFREEKEEYGDLIGECRRIIKNYSERYKDDGLVYLPGKDGNTFEIEVEHRFEVEGTKVKFTGHLDKMPRDTKTGRIFVMDHKCLDVDTPIPTPDGVRPLKHLQVGDLVFSPNGKAIPIVDKVSLVLPAFEITLTSGKKLISSGDHQWPVEINSRVRLLTTERLMERLNRPTKRVPRLMMLPSEPLLMSEVEYSVHPYVIGALLGDGSFTQGPRFCKAHEPTVNRVLSNLPTGSSYTRLRANTDKAPSYYIKSNILKTKLKDWGLLYKHGRDKFIPPEYLLGSVNQRKQLLAGLLDTDGSQRKGYPLFMTGSERLARDVHQLVESLGGVAFTRLHELPHFTKNGVRLTGHPNWTVYMRFPKEFGCPFQHESKSKKWKSPKANPHNMLRILSIEPVGERPLIDLEVNSDDHLFVADGVQTHNSHKVIPDESVRYNDLQLVTYLWLVPLSGFEKADGVLWDYLRTKPPTVPEVLKNGEITKRKNIDTDYDTYLRTVHENNLDPADYKEILDLLKARGTEDYFLRVKLPSPPKAMIENAVTDFKATIAEMIHCEKTSSFTRHMSKDCSWCGMYNLCQAEFRGLDSAFIRKADYRERSEND